MKADGKGFLIADSVISADKLTTGITGVKRDTAIIIRLLKGQTKSAVLQRARVGSSGSSGSRAASPTGPARDSQGRFMAQPGADVARAVTQMTRQQAQQAAVEQKAEKIKRSREAIERAADNSRVRDSRGRFGAGDGDDDKDKGLFARLKAAMSGNVEGGDIDKVDPAIEAANEMKNMVSGVVGGFKSIGELGNAAIGRGFGGGGDKAVPWYRKMLVQLKLMRKESSEFSKAETKAIKGIKPGGGDGGDGFFVSLLKTIFSPIGVALVGAAVAAWATMTGNISDKWDAAVKTFLGIWTPIADYFKDKFGIVTDAAAKAKAAASNAFSNPDNDSRNSGVKDDPRRLDRNQQAIDKQAPASLGERLQSSGGSLLEKIMPGYRHKATFDGIKGGDGLTKNGRYTDAEAARVRQLKGSGANTSANMKGGMPSEIRDKIVAQAKAAGLDPAMMLQMAAMESGGNSNAISATGAIGVFQFTGKTASGVGIKDRFDADQNIAGAMVLAKENAASLRAARLPVTAQNLYMMHQLGPDAAKEVIRGAAKGKNISDLSGNTQKAISHNYGAGVKTAAQYLGKNSAAMRARGDSVVGAAPLAALAPVAAPMAATKMPSAAVSAPNPPAPAPRADVPLPLNSRGPLEVTVKNDQLANQDVRDRRLAQIATGGMTG